MSQVYVSSPCPTTPLAPMPCHLSTKTSPLPLAAWNDFSRKTCFRNPTTKMPATLLVWCCTQARLLLEIHQTKLPGVALFRPEVPADRSWLNTSVVTILRSYHISENRNPKAYMWVHRQIPKKFRLGFAMICLFSPSNSQESIWKNKTNISVWKRQIERITDHVDAPNVQS